MADSGGLEVAPLPADAEVIVRSLAYGGPLLVALSGGVDSSVVAALARDSIGPAVTAATIVGPAVPPDDIAMAAQVARFLGIRHVKLTLDPLQDERYRSNPDDRCYWCRRMETTLVTAWGRPRGFQRFADGVHRDDLRDVRPGIRALNEAGFLHPLLSAEWGKDDVRRFARDRGLPNADAPSNACLASRFAPGVAITYDQLDRVRESERWLRARGFRRVRVRVNGPEARVVVGTEQVDRLLDPPMARAVRVRLFEIGFREVELDPHGYRTRAGT